MRQQRFASRNKKSRHERHVFFSPNGPDVVVLSQNKAASYIYQNNYRNHTGIYQPSAAAHRKDTAKTFLFRGRKKSVSGKLRAVRNA